MPRVMTNSESALSEERVELWSQFFVCGKESTEVTSLFNHLKVGVVRRAQSDWKKQVRMNLGM